MLRKMFSVFPFSKDEWKGFNLTQRRVSWFLTFGGDNYAGWVGIHEDCLRGG